MAASVLGLFGVCLAAAMGELLLVGDEKNGTRRFLRMLVALALLLLLLRPFTRFLGGAEGFLRGEVGALEGESEEFESMLEEAVARRSKRELERGIYALLERDFEIAAEDCRVSVSLDEDGSLRRISVILSGKALLTDPEEIEAAILELLDCEVEVR